MVPENSCPMVTGSSSCERGWGWPAAGMKMGPPGTREIGPADAAPGNVDGDRAGTQRRLRDVLDAEVFASVEACGLHDNVPSTV